jgi:hypothetical protein
MQARLIVLIFTLMTSSAFAQMIRVNDTPSDGIPEEYLVEKGDTLWDICDFYFRDARRWPSVWALNPHVTNPHWIYPGDILRLRMPLPAGEPGSKTPVFKVATGVETARQISLNEGFIGAGEDPTVGRIESSRETHRYLAEGDEVYLKLKNKDSVRIGSQFSIFQPLGGVVHPATEAVLGQKVRMKGIVKVIALGDQTVKARIESSFSEIERGAPIMAIQNHRLTVQPTQNLIDLSAIVVDSLSRKQEQAQFDTIFIDRGEKDGVQIGNRFFVVRRGDGRHELADDARAELPWEQIGEALVVRTQGHSSTALVTRSAIEIRRGDKAVMERHY